MDIRVWHRDEVALTEAEIDREAEIAKEVRADQNTFYRLMYWYMDRRYIESLRKGAGRNEALGDAEGAIGFVLGIAIGVITTLFIVGTIGWATNLYLTARGINLALALIVWIFFFTFGFRKARRGVVKLWRRFRPKVELEPGPKAP